MKEVKVFIESGILEMYVMDQTTPEETAEVERMAAIHDEVRDEIEQISMALEKYAEANAMQPDPNIQIFLLATIDYMARMQGGEAPTFPPALHSGSRIIDFAPWLNRKDLEPAEPVFDAHATIIGYTPEMTTAIVYLKYGAPPETHTNEQEKFLVVEGTCDIIIGEEVNHMKPGDFMAIPLHIPHAVRVTSDCLCRVILQRAAA